MKNSHSPDPLDLIQHSNMTYKQYFVVGVCVFLCALDGFDVLSVSFAAPGIASEWGVDRAALGLVLSMELIGMMFGATLFGRFADSFGRKTSLLFSLLVVAVGMYAAMIATDVKALSAYRLFTGLGLGGVLATINPIVAEFSSLKKRGALVALMASGFSLGSILGGSVASQLLVAGDWRDVFLFGAVCTTLAIPLVYFCVPESVGYILAKKNENQLEALNKTLKQIGHAPLLDIAESETAAKTEKHGWRDLFNKNTKPITIFLTIAFFFHVIASYFILKWTPKLVADMGYSLSLAGSVLVWASVGALMGGIMQSLLSLRFNVKWLTFSMLMSSSILVAIFGSGWEDISHLSWAAGIAMFILSAGQVGIFSLIATSFPTQQRATGTGFVIGIGRGGAAIGPILAGLLFASGFSFLSVSIIMGAGSFIAAIAVLLLVFATKD